MKMVLFITPSPLRSASGTPKPLCCSLSSTHTIPTMAKKRSSAGSSKSKSKSNTPKRQRASPNTTSKSGLQSPPDSKDVATPRGPTLRKEYERKGLIEPSLTPDAGILPEVVSNRMIRRIVTFGGIPLSLLFVFFAVYFVLKYKYDITVLPVVVAFSTLGTVALATGGITYGIFSSSWDEDIDGTKLGWKEAKMNALRAKDGLMGARQREKDEDELDRIDRLADDSEDDTSQ